MSDQLVSTGTALGLIKRPALIVGVGAIAAVLGVALASLLPTGGGQPQFDVPVAESALLGSLARLIRLGGLIALIGGSLVAAWIVLPGTKEKQARDRALRVAVLGAVLWGAGAALELLTVWAAVSSSGSGLDSHVLTALLGARVGSMLALQVLLSAIATAMLVVLAPVGSSAELAGFFTGAVGLAVAVHGGHGTTSAAHQLAGAAITLHVVAAATWVGGLTVTLMTLRQVTDPGAATGRYGAIALVCALIVGGTGVAAGVLMQDPLRLTESGYGLLLIGKVLALGAAVVLAWFARVRLSRHGAASHPMVRFALIELGFLGLAVGLAAVLSQSAPIPSRFVVGIDPLVQAPTAATMLSWTLDPWGLSAALILVFAYGAGLLTLHRRGDIWPAGRTLAFGGGVLVLLLVTCTGMGAYATVLMSSHMVQHMAINMLVPILLVLGAPLSLALRTLPPKPRASLLAAMRSWPARVLLHPLVVTALFTLSLFAVYFTSLFEALMVDHVGHGLMLTHFLITGFLFFWLILGTDPDPHRPSPPARVPHLILAMVAHTIFAVVLVFNSTIIGLELFSARTPLWDVDRYADQALAGGIAWGTGEFLMVGVLIAVVVRWFKASERRDAARRKHARARARSHVA